MSQLSKTIPKHPELKPSEDFYRLRREGIGFIEQMGSSLWTDYNIHDPGITILEALCYALTDIAYRAGWDIKDLLALEPNKPFPKQPFFTAREILTVNPWTPDDFRLLLIDLEKVRNAWVFCKKCGCDTYYYAWCEKDQLKLSYQKPVPQLQPKKVEPQGLYDVLLELEADPELGDLNDRKIEHDFKIMDADGVPHSLKIELRFQEWGIEKGDEWENFLNTDTFNFNLEWFGATKKYNALKELAPDKQDEYLRYHWRNVLYVSFKVGFQSRTKMIENVALRFYGDAFVKNQLTFARLKSIMEDKKIPDFIQTTAGFIRRYRNKEKQKLKVVKTAKTALLGKRNLDEDYCRVKVVNVEEVAVCADVEVKPDADIEWVQARIWFEIEKYFNPPVPFYTLQELMDSGELVEEIFNGPELNSGFIKRKDLESASLKSVLRVSDIINLLMDIDGVIAVNQLQLTKYDAEGNIVKGAADPTWDNIGEEPDFDANKISASWMLYISNQHQPRLYLNGSRFLFYKNGLPFQPRMDEAMDTLVQLRGEAERPKVKSAPKDLPAPTGTNRNPDDYFPVQYSFPLTYGIGPDGLPSHASDKRRAQAKQLQAYLMVFEQLLGNALEQLAHTADLFSLDPSITRTYFVREFSKAVIRGYDEIITGLNKSVLEVMTENRPEFLERRNRFLDHIMARFGEQFQEYALVLTNLQGQQVALDKLIIDKIAFLNDYKLISHDRGKAFNYKKAPDSHNIPILKKRIGLLLGRPDLRFIVVEHLLLRPKFPGDALYPVCSEGACATCGDEDPYSFRLAFVMPGWIEPFNTNMEMRDFADRTIRQEMPAHLLGKICWVDRKQFEDFEKAWFEWLKVNAKFDWTEERLQERVMAILAQNLVSVSGAEKSTEDALCECAAAILTQYGMGFHDWLEVNLMAGRTPDKFTPNFELPGLKLCDGLIFKDSTVEAIKKLLENHYPKYKEVSYRLRVVVGLLSKLNNIYPPATLHDCDEGNDKNPVRLGKTALGGKLS